MSFVRLVESMGTDDSIVQAARVSYGQGTKTPSDDRTLIRYLMRHWHTTPFEMVEFKFHVRCPIFVARQWLRHRTASVNEVSARYSVVKDDFYVPSPYSKQSDFNKQGSSNEACDDTCTFDSITICAEAFNHYKKLLDEGVSREQARIHLPQGTYTEFYWKIDLHNLFGFLQKRMDEHAQSETSILAKKMFELVKPIIPLACEAFEDYRLGVITLTGPEIRAFRDGIPLANRREQIEFEFKKKRLGLVENEIK
jgi:thymidylate synthase (FAD)